MKLFKKGDIFIHYNDPHGYYKIYNIEEETIITYKFVLHINNVYDFKKLEFTGLSYSRHIYDGFIDTNNVKIVYCELLDKLNYLVNE